MYCFSTDYPKIINISSIVDSSTEYPRITMIDVKIDHKNCRAIFSCIVTDHPTLRIMWHTTSRMTSTKDGTMYTLIVTRPGPEAASIYQCLITNEIGCDHNLTNIFRTQLSGL